MTDPSIQPEVNAALDRMWMQFLPQIEERVAVLEAASQALSTGELSDELRDAAQAAAHKLAGVLGTFGLMKGTILAREAEMQFSGDADPESAPQLTEIAGQLRSLIAERKYGNS
jgi:HPt (histidine-containing phosphotransfer) domain-containing protein